jgi:hypothetical protein
LGNDSVVKAKIGDRIKLNDYADIHDREYPVMRVYSQEESRIDNDYSPRREERSVSLSVEILDQILGDSDKDVVEGLEYLAEAVNNALTLSAINEYLVNYGDIKIWSITWTKTALGFYWETGGNIPFLALDFELEYQALEIRVTLDDLKTVGTEFKAVDPGGAELEGSIETSMEE